MNFAAIAALSLALVSTQPQTPKVWTLFLAMQTSADEQPKAVPFDKFATEAECRARAMAIGEKLTPTKGLIVIEGQRVQVSGFRCVPDGWRT